jgi:hypothetical protein
VVPVAVKGVLYEDIISTGINKMPAPTTMMAIFNCLYFFTLKNSEMGFI